MGARTGSINCINPKTGKMYTMDELKRMERGGRIARWVFGGYIVVAVVICGIMGAVHFL